MTRLADQRGFTLIELLIASAMMIVILLATLSVFDASFQSNRRNEVQNDAQSSARHTTDQLARELRNVANPGQATGLERAGATDLVFDMIDPTGAAGGSNTYNVRRVRYCLDSSVASNQKIWREFQTWTTASPPTLSSTTTCPDLTWNHPPQIVVDHITNDSSHPLFSYDSSTLSSITQLITDIFVGYRSGGPPGSTELRSSVSIRSTAQPPSAVISVTPEGNKQVVMNGGGSTDPNGQPLTYLWKDGSTQIGTTAIFTYSSPTTGSHTFSLTVTNSSGLSSTATQTVAVT